MTSPNTIIADMQAEIDALRKENEALLNNLRGKYSLTGATYAHLIKERNELLYELESLVTRCDGEDGMRADLSNIDTSHAHAVIAKATPC